MGRKSLPERIGILILAQPSHDTSPRFPGTKLPATPLMNKPCLWSAACRADHKEPLLSPACLEAACTALSGLRARFGQPQAWPTRTERRRQLAQMHYGTKCLRITRADKESRTTS